MRCQLLLWFFVWSLPLLADDEVRDSVKVQEVEITASRLKHFAVTDKVEQVDILAIQRYAAQDIGALLQKTSLINIQSNGGAGALTTASIRGAASNQTLVTWNGLPLNSLTTGASDLSTISAGGFNDVRLTYGAAGSLYGSGTMGGVIELSNQPRWQEGLKISVSNELGSYLDHSYAREMNSSTTSKGDFKWLSSYKGNLRVQASNRTLSYAGQVFYQDAKNNFNYIDDFDHGQPTETSQHNRSEVFGTLHSLYWQAGKNLFDFGAWYQVKEKELPGLMGVGAPISHQTQKDSTLKLYVGWKRLIRNFRLEGKAAYIYDFIRYTDKDNADSESFKIFSEIAAKSWFADLSTRWYVNDNLSVDVNGRYSYLKAITANYASNIVEHEGRLNAAIKYSPEIGVFIATVGKDWCSSESDEVKQPIYENGEIAEYEIIENSLPNPPLMFSLSGKIIISPQWLAARGKVATHFRRPTFNDRYWKPGGNLSLKPEEGFNYEVGFEMFEQKTNWGSIGADLAFYRASNNESIAWKPSSNGLWMPINTNAIISQGFDVSASHRLQIGNHQVRNRIIYGYNDAYDNNSESAGYKETLGYRPKHTFKFISDFIASQWNVGAMLYSRSQCNTWEGREVEAYALVDVNTAYTIDRAVIDIGLMARVENIFDTSYQLVWAYPMPGRAYYLTVNFIF
ncbi:MULTISPECIES: TonB-dependent receptor domain-containing protein [unclassified Carboxylicivirga]|uniref:TonB-dependent receptor plug domain-containing protein n=1 Tax=Carboxylicivirga TaxID=1628153 RepID=UPI003D34E1DE